MAVYYSNRSASYYQLHEYENSLEDSKKALEIDQTYIKAIIRKAQWERELLLNEDCLETWSAGLDLEK